MNSASKTWWTVTQKQNAFCQPLRKTAKAARYEITKRLNHYEDREVVDTARTMAEANRKVGELNRQIGSSMTFGWRRVF